MYPCLLLKVLAEYDLQLCACSKRDSCKPVFLVRLARGYTPRLHLGGGGGQNWWVFSAIPHLELGKTPLPKGLVLGQISVRRLMLLMLVVSWPRCLGVSAEAADAGRIVATLRVLL